MSGPRRPRRPDLADLPVNVWLVGQQNSLMQRRGRYTPESMRHPGKMLPELARRIIESYTQPEAWILDPMSGIGTTGVEAVHLNRNYVGVEWESRFVRMQEANLRHAKDQGAAGQFSVFSGDARRLAADTGVSGVSPDGPVDAVITSPPYGSRLRSVRTPTPVLQQLMAQRQFGRNVIPGTYGDRPGNLGNLSDAEYLRQMRQVYEGCFAVLRPGGPLIVVIRPGRDRFYLRPLHHRTVDLCLEAGFEFLDEIIAVVGRVELPEIGRPRVVTRSLFFKRLAIAHLREAGHPVTLEQLEYVLVFRKPDGSQRTPDRLPRPDDKSGLSAALVDPHRYPRSAEFVGAGGDGGIQP